MFEPQHKTLVNDGRWAQMTLAQQMANIGSEVSRSTKWLIKNNPEQAERAFYRGLELIDCSIDSTLKFTTLKELCRLRENYCELFLDKNIRELQNLIKYFDYFAIESLRTNPK